MKLARFKARAVQMIVEEKRGTPAGEVEPKTIVVVEEEARKAFPPAKKENDEVDVSFMKEAIKPASSPSVVGGQEKEDRDNNQKRRVRGLVGEFQGLTFLSKNSWSKLLLWLFIIFLALAATFLCLNCRLHLRQSSSL